MEPPDSDGRSLVVVIDGSRCFRYYVSPGRARMLLRDREARLFGHSPATIQLVPGAAEPPEDERFPFRSATTVVQVVDRNGNPLKPTFAAKATGLLRGGRAVLTGAEPPTIRLVRIVRDTVERRPIMKPDYMDQEGHIVNWSRFWAEERDIYVRNLSEFNISIEVLLPNGKDTRDARLFVSPDPVNLTAEIDYSDLKRSSAFRKLANARQPKSGRPHIQILTEDEFRRYFEMKAQQSRRTADEEIERAGQARMVWRDEERRRLAAEPYQQPNPHQRVVDPIDQLPLQHEDGVIRDRLQVIMHNVARDVLDEQGKAQASGQPFSSGKVRSASAILTDLQTMQDLSETELEFIRSKCFWPSVKRWCDARLSTLRMSDAVDPSADAAAMDDGDSFVRQGISAEG